MPIPQESLTEYMALCNEQREKEKKVRELRKKRAEFEEMFIANHLDVEDGNLILEVAESESSPRLSKANVTLAIGEPAYNQLMIAIRQNCPNPITRKFSVVLK